MSGINGNNPDEKTPQMQGDNPQREESTSTSIPTSTTIGGGRKRQRRQDWIDTAFRETTKLLEELPSDGARFLAPMPSVVSLRNAVKDPPSLPFSFAPRRPRRSNSNISTNTTANSGSGGSIPNEGCPFHL